MGRVVAPGGGALFGSRFGRQLRRDFCGLMQGFRKVSGTGAL